MKLNKRDSRAFVAAILDAPEPNEALKKAAANYKNRALECGHTPAEVAGLCAALARSADRAQTNSYVEIADIARRAEQAIRYLLAAAEAEAREAGDE